MWLWWVLVGHTVFHPGPNAYVRAFAKRCGNGFGRDDLAALLAGLRASYEPKAMKLCYQRGPATPTATPTPSGQNCRWEKLCVGDFGTENGC